jgi:hypothetical protein
MYDQGMSIASQCVEPAGKPFQFLEGEQADLIAGRTMERQLNDAFLQSPRHRSSLKIFHVLCPLGPTRLRGATDKPTTDD